MSGKTPLETVSQLMEAFEKGDIEAALNQYEPEASHKNAITVHVINNGYRTSLAEAILRIRDMPAPSSYLSDGAE